MKKKNYAALAVALVTGGLAAKVSKAGLYSPTAVQNGDFEKDITAITAYTYNQAIANWYRVSGNEEWLAQSAYPVANTSNNAYATLVGNGTKAGEIFQSVGTFTSNYNVSISVLEASLSGATSGHNLIVSLYSGGTPTYTGYSGYAGYGQEYYKYSLSNATFLNSKSILDTGTNAFNLSSFVLNTGTKGAAGASLWLDISTDATSASLQLGVDNVTATGATILNLATWKGTNSTTWDSSTANFQSSSGASIAFSNGADVLFDDTASSAKTSITVSGSVSPSTITFNNSTNTYTIGGSGNISGGTSLTKNGTGTTILSTVNSFTGPVNVNAGTLAVTNGSALGTSQAIDINTGGSLAFQNTSGITMNLPLFLNGGTIVNTSGANTLGGALYVLNPSTVNVSSGSFTVSSALYGNANLTKIGTGTLSFNNVGYFSGDAIVNGGTLVVNGYDVFDGTNTTVNAGATLVMNNGGGYGAICSTNLNINGGIVQADAPNGDALGYDSGHEVTNVNITSGGVFNDGVATNEGYDTQWNLTGGSITSTGGGEIQVDAAAGYGFTSFASGTMSLISASIAIRSGTLTFTVAQGTVPSGIDLEVSGNIGDSGGSSIDKEGPGTLALAGSNTYKGAISVGGGTLMFGDGTVGHNPTISTSSTINDNATVAFNPFASQTISNSIQGSGNLVKVGSGALTLSGSSYYGGTTNVSAGKLYVNGSIGSGTGVSVGSGATLGGSGSVNEPVTVAAGGIIEGGASGSGQLNVNGLTFNGSGTVNISGVANYSSGTALQVNGTLTTASANSVTINVTNIIGASTGTAYELIGYGAESGPGVGSYVLALPRGDTGTLSDTGSMIDVTLNSIVSSPFLTWTGAANSANGWDTTTKNWTFGGVPSTYIDNPGDQVLFDDTPGANQTVAIKSGDVHPTSVTFNNSSYTYTVTGPNAIAGTGGLTVNGTGTVILTNSNTYTGNTVINSGTLQLGNGTTGHDGSLSASSAITNTGTLVIDNFGPATFANAVSNSSSGSVTGTVAFNGSGAVTLTGAILGGENLVVNGSGSVTSNTAITATGTVTMNGTGTLTLNGANSYTVFNVLLNISTGVTNVNSGTVIVNGSVSGRYTQYYVASGASLYLGYSSGGGYTGSITLNGSGLGSSAGLYLLGGINFETNQDLIIQTAPTTISTYGTGSATLQGFDIYTGAFLSTTAAASGSIISSSINISTGSYGYNVAATLGANNSTGDLTIQGNISGTGSYGLTKFGTGSVKLTGTDTYSGTTGTNISAGTLIFASPTAFPAFTQLIIELGATAVAANHGSGAKNNLLVSNLNIAGASGAWTGLLDLSNNDMVVRGGSLSNITNQVAQGYNGGNWQGSGGITSSTAAANSKHLTALGVIANDNGTGSGTALYTTFDGTTVAEGDVLVKYTYYGDTNLDGKVDGSDYSRIDAAALSDFSNPGSATGWFNGDFNYDGIINGSDYTLIDNAYNTQGALISAQIASPTAQIAGATSAVPEPATLGLLGLGAIGLLGRRRRQF